MNAHSFTAIGIAAGLTGTPRVTQTVHRVVSTYCGDMNPRHIVLVVPEGQTRGEYYDVSDRTFALLRVGMSPEYLEIEPVAADELEAMGAA